MQILKRILRSSIFEAQYYPLTRKLCFKGKWDTRSSFSMTCQGKQEWLKTHEPFYAKQRKWESGGDVRWRQEERKKMRCWNIYSTYRKLDGGDAGRFLSCKEKTRKALPLVTIFYAWLINFESLKMHRPCSIQFPIN